MATETTPKKETATAAVNTDKLASDIETLKSDISQIAGTLRELGLQSKETAIAEGRRRYEMARVMGHEQVDHLRNSAEDIGHQATAAVRERPATALLIAAGVGMLFGFLSARK